MQLPVTSIGIDAPHEIATEPSAEYDYDYENYEYVSFFEDYEEQEGTNTQESNKTINKIDFSRVENTWEREEETDNLPRGIYCDLVNTLSEKCVQNSILEIWEYDEGRILAATQQEILDAINLLTVSPWFGYSFNYSSILGGVVRNETGHIVSATTAKFIWVLHVPDDVDIVESQGTGLELELADEDTLEWEEQSIDIALNASIPGVRVFYNAQKSFSEISTEAIFFDGIKMACGYLIMFIFTIFMLGRKNSLEVRLYLTMVGILGIIMGLIIAVGLSSALGYPYTPMHAMLPFLFLGEFETFYYRGEKLKKIYYSLAFPSYETDVVEKFELSIPI